MQSCFDMNTTSTQHLYIREKEQGKKAFQVYLMEFLRGYHSLRRLFVKNHKSVTIERSDDCDRGLLPKKLVTSFGGSG